MGKDKKEEIENAFFSGYMKAEKDFLELIETLRLYYRKIGSIQEQKLCEKLKEQFTGEKQEGEE